MDAVDDASQPLDYHALFAFWSLSVIFLRQFRFPIRFTKAAGAVVTLLYPTAVTRPV